MNETDERERQRSKTYNIARVREEPERLGRETEEREREESERETGGRQKKG